MSKEWQEATDKLNMAREREAGEPVELNPISNYMKNNKK